MSNLCLSLHAQLQFITAHLAVIPQNCRYFFPLKTSIVRLLQDRVPQSAVPGRPSLVSGHVGGEKHMVSVRGYGETTVWLKYVLDVNHTGNNEKWYHTCYPCIKFTDWSEGASSVCLLKPKKPPFSVL